MNLDFDIIKLRGLSKINLSSCAFGINEKVAH